RVDGLSRNADAFRQAEARRTGSDAKRAGEELQAYQNVEAALEQSQLYPALTNFETSLQQLATDPVDSSLRSAVLENARTLTRTFNIAGQGLDTVASGLQFGASDGVSQVNLLAQQLARVNVQLVRAVPGTSDQVSLLDQRDSLLKNLSGYVDVSTSFAPDQSVEVRIGGAAGPQLVSGNSATPLAMATAADGTLSFALGAAAVSPTSGSLAAATQGLIMVRDTHAQLDGVATSLIAAANGAQASGAALDGSPGQPLFSGTNAATIGLALTSGAGIATAPAGAGSGSRDPAGLNALRTALSTANIEGQTNGLLFDVSSATQGRKLTSDALGSIAGAAKLALDSQAGVNLDEEAVNLVKYQQAFQACGKAIQVASTLFDTLLAIR
ncbi:MAG: flagellar hook-associated protein FlgK, partial [Novosphingobium sp.]